MCDEQSNLELMARCPKTDQHTAQRTRIVLDCAQGLRNTAASVKRGVTLAAVGKWCQRFLNGRLRTLDDATRFNQPSKLAEAKVETVITRTLKTWPKNATRWSTRNMVEASGMTKNAIVRNWRAFGLKPHLQEKFKLSTDPFVMEKMQDIVGLYLNPPEQTRGLVLCVDEKSHVQALDRSQPVLPMHPGQAEPTPMITPAMPPLLSSRRWASLLVKSSAHANPATVSGNLSAF